MRRPSTFKKTDVTRLTKAVLDAGLSVASVAVSNGVITVVPGKPAEDGGEVPTNEWDEVLNGAPSTAVR